MMTEVDLEVKYGECALCGGEDIKLLYKRSDFNILRCAACRFIFSDYKGVFFDKDAAVPEKGLSVKDARIYYDREKKVYYERFERELSAISKFKKSGNILDIGCGFGFFLELAKKRGWKTYGIDLDRDAVEFCGQALSLDVVCGELDRGRYPEKYFDVVTMFHSLEHVPDFQKIMAIVKRIIKPGGLVVIDVPNADDLRRVCLAGNWAHFRKDHLWYFSARTLRRLMSKHGFGILGFRPHGGSELVFYLDKQFPSGIKRSYARYFWFLNPIRNILTGILNFLGFNEDITVYARRSYD